MEWFILALMAVCFIICIVKARQKKKFEEREAEFKELEIAVLRKLKILDWWTIDRIDWYVTVKSRQAL